VIPGAHVSAEIPEFVDDLMASIWPLFLSVGGRCGCLKPMDVTPKEGKSPAARCCFIVRKCVECGLLSKVDP
jgi:hypothetical protein